MADERLEELATERARLWEELHRLRAVEADRDHWHRVAKNMESSVSWRITSPLRVAKKYGIKLDRLRRGAR